MCCVCVVFVFKQKTAYEMRISDWSSDVCSSDLQVYGGAGGSGGHVAARGAEAALFEPVGGGPVVEVGAGLVGGCLALGEVLDPRRGQVWQGVDEIGRA